MKDVDKVLFDSKNLAQLDASIVPQHVAIIPDGNRRWATREVLANDPTGHRHGAHNVLDIVEAAGNMGIKTLTLYTFSTENWSRPSAEVDLLIDLIESYLKDQRERMIQEGVKLGIIGDISRLPPSVQQTIHITKEATQHCETINLVLAINYGARDELCRVMRTILQETQSDGLDPKNIDEHFIAKYLDTEPWGDPALLIRTSGEMRISNFLLWQLSYTELYVTDTLWPDFTPDHLLKAILDYQRRERRNGA